MSGLLLSDAERKRFIDWLELSESSSNDLLKAAEGINLPGPLLARLKFETAACHFLAHKLRTTESMSIGGEEPGTANVHEGQGS